MNLKKQYYGLDGNACNILQMVKNDPEWAANRIQEGEKAIERLASIKEKPKKSRKNDYSEIFKDAWSNYPKRAGDNSKAGAWKAWSARLKGGESEYVMHSGTLRYFRFCQVTGKIETEYVKHASTFYGPKEPYLEKWDIPTNSGQQSGGGYDAIMARMDAQQPAGNCFDEHGELME